MSPKSNHFCRHRNTHSYQVTPMQFLISGFSVIAQTLTYWHRWMPLKTIACFRSIAGMWGNNSFSAASKLFVNKTSFLITISPRTRLLL